MKSAVIILSLFLVNIAQALWVDLWPGQAPGAETPAAGSEKINEGGRYTDIEKPQYQFYPAPKDKATGAAVAIFPGGGYSILAMDHEGHAYAKWLNELGISAMLVKYRVSGKDDFGYFHPVPYLDARRAIRTLRSRAAEWRIDAQRIGVMGSSAGGHLASTCATRFRDVFVSETKDAIDLLDCRPNFAVLIYPVISLDSAISHGGSRRRLLGPQPNPKEITELSGNLALSAQTPPVFLVSTADDGVDCRNSLLFAAACKEHKVPVSLHLFESGGHGYGLNGIGEIAVWPDLLKPWILRVSVKK
jgi:acetyl esterase/lipase